MTPEDKIPIEIDISSRHDSKGVDEAKSGLGGIEKGIASASQKAELFGKILRGVGWFGLIQQGIAIFNSLKEKIDNNRNAAKELNDKIAEINRSGAVKATAEEYKKLGQEIARVNQRLEEKNALEEMASKTSRAKEDASSRLSEIRELMALSPDDPLRAEKEGEIRAKYSSSRAVTAAQRKREDIDADIARTQQTRERLSAEAGVDNLAAGELSQNARLKRRLAQEAELAGQEYKVPGILEPWKTAAPDPAAMIEGAKKAAALRKEASELEAKAAERQAAAEEKSARRAALLDQIEAKAAERGTLSVEEQVVRAEGSSARRAAASRTEAQRRSIRSGRSEKEEERSRMLDSEDAADRLLNSADQAEDELFGLKSNSMRQSSEAAGARELLNRTPKNRRKGRQWDWQVADTAREENEAREANAAYAEALKSLKDMIKEYRDEAEKFLAEVRQLRERQNSARSDGGNID